MIFYEMFILSLAVLIQPTLVRFFAAFVFIAITIGHALVLGEAEGFAYYGSAAALDLTIIGLTCGVNPVPRMILQLHKICFVSILLNSAGWVLWVTYSPLTSYNGAYVILYAWTIWVFIERDQGDGFTTDDSLRACFRFNRRSWFNFNYWHKGKI